MQNKKISRQLLTLQIFDWFMDFNKIAPPRLYTSYPTP